MNKEKIDAKVEKLIEKGKKKGTLTIEEVSDKLASLNAEEIDEIMEKIKSEGIKIVDTIIAISISINVKARFFIITPPH